VMHELSSIAFPSISTGAFGYPIAEAAEVAVRTVGGALRTFPTDVTFCCHSPSDLAVYEGVLARWNESAG
jgi:O-acetyl-ADP-ribose deacetylase